jgi:hypothetical protein
MLYIMLSITKYRGHVLFFFNFILFYISIFYYSGVPVVVHVPQFEKKNIVLNNMTVSEDLIMSPWICNLRTTNFPFKL